MSDLVKRLREMTLYDECQEAADALEAMRAEIERLREREAYLLREWKRAGQARDKLQAVVDAAKQELRDVGSGPGWVAFRILSGADTQTDIERLKKKCDYQDEVIEQRNAMLTRLGQKNAKLQAVVDAAKGLNFGEDWNKGTHAEIYRPKLREALAALEGGDE